METDIAYETDQVNAGSGGGADGGAQAPVEIQAVNVSVTPDPIRHSNDPLTFWAQVCNRSDRATGAFKARMFLDSQQLDDIDIDNIPPGGLLWVQKDHDPLPAGDHYLDVAFDPANVLGGSQYEHTVSFAPFKVDAPS